MNKNEILEKSRHENIYGDERDKLIDLKSIKFGNIVMAIVYVVVSYFAKVKGNSMVEARIIFMSLMASQTGYILFLRGKLRDTKNLLHLFMLIIFIIFLTFDFIELVM